MATYAAGQTIEARGRKWIVEIAPEYDDVDILIANPIFTEEEYRRIEVADRAWDKRQRLIPSGVFAQRDVICLEEIAA
jgi:hypothetical protein